MPNKRDISLWKYDISQDRYRELHYWCKQYYEWKSKLNYGLKGINYNLTINRSGYSNPTEIQAIKNEKYIENIKILEETCKEADSTIWEYLLNNVTRQVTYEEMDVPMGRRQFYNARRKFFYILDLKRP